MTLTGSALTITRGAAWGDNSTFSTIGAEALADFGSNAAMNAFFNTGGEIRWSLAHPSAATAQDTSWLNLLNSLGPFNIHGGSSKAQSATVVYYPLNSLTTTYQTIFTATSASTSYTSNTVTINAKLNAASTGVVIQVLLTDAHANAFYDSVAAGTRITFSHLKSTVVLTGITTPTFTTITNF
jgi:hypothetical protein